MSADKDVAHRVKFKQNLLEPQFIGWKGEANKIRNIQQVIGKMNTKHNKSVVLHFIDFK